MRMKEKLSLPSVFVLIIMAVATGWAGHVYKEIGNQRLVEHYNFRVELLQSVVNRRMLEYEAILSGGAGLFAANGQVSRAQWHDYVDSLRVDTYFPGIQGYGVTKMIAPNMLSQHIRDIRSEGFSDYVVKPQGPRDLYSAIIYLEPFSGRNLRAFGYDMYSEQVRRTAMDYARDTKGPAMSGMVTLVQETDTDVQKGFLMYLPLYRKDMPVATIQNRRDALEGFVYSVFRIKDMMRGILAGTNTGVEFEIFDGDQMTPQSFAFSSQGRDAPYYGSPDLSPLFTSTRAMTIGGRKWTLHFYALPNFAAVGGSDLSKVIVAAGMAITLLIFGLMNLLSQRHQKIKAAAEDMTHELSAKNQDLGQFTEILAHHLQEPVRLQIRHTARLEKLLDGMGMTDEVKAVLIQVKRGGERLRLLMRDVQIYLALSQSHWELKLCNANEAVDAALGRLDDKIAEKQAIIDVSNLPLVLINRDRLIDVFASLIENGLVYCRNGVAPIIKIGAKIVGDMVTFTIEDNGIGIPKEYHERVFNVFERLSPEDSPPGTGIGLSLVKKIVETAHGQVWIETAEGGGTCVLFSLFCAEGGENEQSVPFSL